MSHAPMEGEQRRRAGMVLLGIVAAVVALIVVVVAVVVAQGSTDPPGTPALSQAAPPLTAGHESWDLATQNALAAQPMLQLPPQAAQPQAMTTQNAGPPIMLPRPRQTVGRWIPGGLPATPEGAIAQLKALDENAMRGGDPEVYAHAYRELSLPGAPDPRLTGLSAVLTSFRSHAGLASTGIVPGLEATYEVTHGLVKGSTDGGRYTVVCVLGQLSVAQRGRTISAGVGDCQAMRWTGTGWRISPGALAAPASSAWPGSADAVKAGYRELS